MKKSKIIGLYIQSILLSFLLVLGVCTFQLLFVLGIESLTLNLILIPALAALVVGIFIATILIYRKLTPEHPFKIYVTYTFLTFCIIETFFSLQVIFVLKEFKPQYAIVPTTLSILIGVLLSTVILFKQRLQKSHEDLAGAHQEIQRLNQRLETDNLRMSSELAVAQRLQKMLLPSNADLQQTPHLEIASFMQMADEIGGDYYDVIQHKQHTRIVMGDVTGHGLESGVLMLMAQATLRTLILHDVSDPIQLLTTLNRNIYESVKRTRMDRNLTLTMLDYIDGQVTITGQHEEILIVRKNGTVERIDTLELGFLIGLEPDIEHLLASMTIQLNIGDGIVLYTDGLVEAQDTAKTVFGLERLCQIIQQHWQKTSAEQLIEQIIAAVKTHTQTQQLLDDLSLLICKRQI